MTVDRYVPGYRSEALEFGQSTSGESWTMLAEKVCSLTSLIILVRMVQIDMA